MEYFFIYNMEDFCNKIRFYISLFKKNTLQNRTSVLY